VSSNGSLGVMAWIPLASLVAVEAYARTFDGWGAWATAPLFLIPLVLGAVIGGVGVVKTLLDLRAGVLDRSTVASTILALSPVAWLLVRRHLV
jgi:hypothetical protein